MDNKVTLPPIKHVFKGLFTQNDPHYSQGKHSHVQDRPCCGPPSHVGQGGLFSAPVKQPTSTTSPCHCGPPPPFPCCSPTRSKFQPSPPQQQFQHRHHHHHHHHHQEQQPYGRVHRRTASGSMEFPVNKQYYYPVEHHNMAGKSMEANNYWRYDTSAASHFPNQTEKRRSRAHTTSGYPPTMLYQQSHVQSKQTPSQIIISSASSENNALPKPNATHHRYHCNHCRKSFSRPSSLRIHIYSHTGEKPYKCPHVGCGRSFSVHSNMRRHLRVHYCPPHHGGNGMGSMRLPLVPNRFSDEEDEEDEDTESNRFDMQCNNMNIIKRGCTTSPPSTKLPSFSSLHSKS